MKPLLFSITCGNCFSKRLWLQILNILLRGKLFAIAVKFVNLIVVCACGLD